MPRKRDTRLNIRVNEEEKDFILKNMQKNGFKNVTDFLIECITRHKTTVVDTMPLFAVKNEINKVGVNINQVAKIANTGRTVNYDMLLELQKDIDKMHNIVNNAFAKEIDDGLHENRTDKDRNAS